MKNILKPCFFILGFLLITLTACGSDEYDSRNPESLNQMIRGNGMSLKEAGSFLDDVSLLIYLLSNGGGGNASYVINGYTVKRIRAEAKVAHNYVKELNSQFIAKTIAQIDKNGRQEACIAKNGFGIFLSPIGRHCKRISRESLVTILNELNGSNTSK